MGNYQLGYVTPEIITKTVGSPAVLFKFSDITNSVLIDNIGSTPIYFNFDQTATTGSTSGYIAGTSFRAFDLSCGSISILGSGGLAPLVMCVRLT